MEKQKQDFARAVMITRDHWDVPVRVRLRSYVQFSDRLDDQLRSLVARWQHTAAPAQSGTRRRKML